MDLRKPDGMLQGADIRGLMLWLSLFPLFLRIHVSRWSTQHPSSSCT